MLKVLSVAVAASVAASALADDQITALPGLNFDPNFKQYSGYITVDKANNRRLFYWFVESQNDPSTDPVVLWQNGGPGCSSVGGGLMSELGPFYPNSTGSGLDRNEYSWNKIANVLFVESPAGVGFSYSDVESDYTVGDLRTAADLHTLLVTFFEMYPQVSKNPFWLAGESYGGHYVPNLAKYILESNEKSGAFQINLQGFLVGNAWTDAALDNYGAAYYWYTHALVSDSTFNGVVTQCNLSEIGPLAMGLDQTQSVDTALSCDDYQNLAFQEMGNINIYDVYVDVCGASGNKAPSAETHEGRRLLQALGRLTAGSDTTAGGSKDYDPCIGGAVSKYLNRPDVQHAIHARTDLPYQWSMCSSVLNYSRSDLLNSMLPVYRYLLDHNIRMLVFSGDVDAIVPVTGTRAWLSKLNLPVKEAWRSWTVNGQVGGYVTEYDGLTFSTVRNAGHMVPYTQQDRAFHMFSHWISGQPF